MKKIKKLFSLVIIVVFLILQPFHNIIEISALEVGNDSQDTSVNKKALIVIENDESEVALYEKELSQSDNIQIITLQNNDEVTIIEEFDDFSKVLYLKDDIEYNGFIQNEYLQVITIDDPPTTEIQTEQEVEKNKPNFIGLNSVQVQKEVSQSLTKENSTATIASTTKNDVTPIPEQQTIQGIALKNKTNIYKSKSRNNGILKSYNQGTLLKFKTIPSSSWYEARVKVNGKWHTGYIHPSDVELQVEKQQLVTGIALQSSTKVYKRASTNSGAWKSYSQGSILKYRTFSKNWYQARVKVKGKWQTGYIHKSHVENANEKQELLSGIALKSSTKVYKRASTNSGAWKSYSQGSILKYKTFSKNWYKARVKVKGKWQTGYIHKSHVENAVKKQTSLRGVAIQKPTRVYKKANTKSGAWKSYSQGSILKYKTFSNNWYQTRVKVKGKWKTGYIHKNHVDNLVDKQQSVNGLALKSPTRAYSQPDTKSKVLKSYKIGSNLKYKTFSKNWYKATVKIKGKSYTAYFHKNHVGERRLVNYNVSLSQALKAQMAARPKTNRYYDSKTNTYRTDMYVPKSNLIKENGKWKVKGKNINVRSGPGTKYSIIGKLDENYTKDTITVFGEQGNYYKFNTWIIATEQETKRFLDPNRYKSNDFIFLKLNRSTGVSASEVNNKILKGKGILEGRASAFINASKKYNINEIYLISHAFLETGHGKSVLANGVEVGINKNGKHVLVTNGNRSSLKNIKITYNMFGIGAYDNCALECGAIRAYQEGWFSPNAAITGGAKFIATDYIHNGQDTLYKMRWNPDAIANSKSGTYGRQYATDIAWAEKQSNIIKNLYSQLNSYQLTFEVPKYK